MNKVATLFDKEIKMEYDLYLINARQLKDIIISNYNLTENKYLLFNSSTHLKQELENGFHKRKLNFDPKEGTILSKTDEPDYFK